MKPVSHLFEVFDGEGETAPTESAPAMSEAMSGEKSIVDDVHNDELAHNNTGGTENRNKEPKHLQGSI